MRIEALNQLVLEVSQKTGLNSDKVRQLIGLLTAMLFDETSGGFSGFMARLRERGLGASIQSWLGHGPNEALPSEQVERAFGPALISTIANKLDLTPAAAASAIGATLPGLVDGLSENGQEPRGIPESLRHWVGEIGEWFGELGKSGWGAATAGAAAVGGAIAGGARTLGHAADATTQAASDAIGKAGGGSGKWLPWLLLGAALIVAFLLFKGCAGHPAQTPPAETPPPAADAAVATPPPAAPAASAPAAQTVAGVAIENAAGKAVVSGRLSSDAEKAKLMDALKATFGAENVQGEVAVDAAAAPAAWLDRLIGFLPELKAAGAKLSVDGDKIAIDTSALPDDRRLALSEKLRGIFGDFEISGLWDKGISALSSLKAGFSADDLVKALNLAGIHFATGSATITRDSSETLRKAAEAIKATPEGTRIEVGGHTDNTGDAAANLRLSVARADAVKARLLELGVPEARLVAKGYGQDKPIADNATESGRAQNRRMEFSVLR
ncbi:OmpA family protein [Lysobacter sp. K5869]|uniref:OmpA family protein n=1 Tax=Lysobacter sp. K5869 TaxID=2820808 RepID=UPI001C061ADD|nr:OmpA family protein [Lysobacter sp. K5869]QWP75295.1 OmpA family protein [Lysobacter sp. K5869]